MFTALQMISSQFFIRDSFPFSHLEKFLGRLPALWEGGKIDSDLKSSFSDGRILAACSNTESYQQISLTESRAAHPLPLISIFTVSD